MIDRGAKMGATTDCLVEDAMLDLTFLEIVMPGGDDGGVVEFSVKELLQDISAKIEKVGESTKADLQATELRLTTYIHNVDVAAKEREAVQVKRIETLEADSVANKIQWARVAGIAGLGSLFGGGTVALIAQALA